MAMIKFIVLGLLVAVSLGWRCGGAYSDIGLDPVEQRLLMGRSSIFSKIRINYQYINFDSGNSSINEYFKSTVMTSVSSYLSSAVKVHSVINNLIIAAKTCNRITIPSQHQTSGLPDSDLAIYVTTNKNSSSDISISTTVCSQDYSNLDIPTSGLIVINTNYLQESTFGQLLSTLVHASFHVLGFNSALYQYWKDSKGSPYDKDITPRNIPFDGNKFMLNTPNILAKAMEAFGCNSIDGIDLEDFENYYRGSYYRDSHWEKRIMFNDFMVTDQPDAPIFSTISLALLRDTGWYDVDYSYAVVPIFGTKSNCRQFNSKCLSQGRSNFPELFCDSKSLIWTCDVFALQKSFCGVYRYSTIPSSYSYYINKQDPNSRYISYFGGDKYADYCPLLTPYKNGNCFSSSANILADSDEVIGVSSRCFVSTLSRTTSLSEYAACYQVIHCTEIHAVVKIGDQTLDCPFTGGVFSVKGYNGNITCPNSNVLCERVPCIDNCSGHGKCVDGKCVCDVGFSGDSCFVSKCGSLCKSCSHAGCVECFGGYYLMNSHCWKCSYYCSFCVNATTCTKCIDGYKLENESCV